MHGHPSAATAMDSRHIPPCDGFNNTMPFEQSLGRLSLYPIRLTITRKIDGHVTRQSGVQGVTDLKLRPEGNTVRIHIRERADPRVLSDQR